MFDLGRTAPESVPLPELNREYFFFNLLGELSSKSSDGLVRVWRGEQGVRGLQGLKGEPGPISSALPKNINQSATPVMSLVSQISSAKITLSNSELLAGLVLDFSVMGILSLGSSNNGRMSVVILVGGNVTITIALFC